MDSGNPKGNSHLILPLQKRLVGQLCCQTTRSADFVVLGFGELFRCSAFSLEENRVILARPYEGCYMIPNNEVVDSFIVAAIITSQLLCVRSFWSPAFLIPQRRSKSMAREFSIN